MKKLLLVLSSWFMVFVLAGCVVRTYQVKRDRIDQDLSAGNRGYLQGQAPSPEERKSTRTIQTVEVELGSPRRFEKTAKPKSVEKPVIEETEEQEALGSREVITESYVPETQETVTAAPSFEQYTIQKGDTLQKISKKFYGTTKRWMKIYEANKDTLKGPNKIYPGQVINIPQEALKEPKENLK